MKTPLLDLCIAGKKMALELCQTLPRGDFRYDPALLKAFLEVKLTKIVNLEQDVNLRP